MISEPQNTRTVISKTPRNIKVLRVYQCSIAYGIAQDSSYEIRFVANVERSRNVRFRKFDLIHVGPTMCALYFVSGTHGL